MYSVYCDGELIYDLDSKYNVLIDPTVNLELNKAPTFDFTMPPNHPFYDRIERFKSIIQVLQDGDEIFKGRAIQVQDDMNMNRYVYCEGELAYLNDTIQRPAEFHLDGYAVIRYIEMLLESHNAQVDPDGDYEKYGIEAVPRYFEPGYITIGDPNDYLYRYTNMNTTMEEIKEDLVDDLGGYLRVRNVYKDDNPLGTLEHRYLDYIGVEEYGKTSEQAIEFGENLLDYLSDIDQTDICTGIIPLGALLEEENEFSALETRLTIEDVNDGSDYLVIPEAVEKYGLILKTVTWDDVTTPAALKSNGEAYLATYRYDDMTIEAKAVDLSLITPGESSRETLTSREVLEAYETVVYTLTAKNTITEIISYEVYDRDDTGYAKITRISFSGNTVSVTVDNSSRTDDLDITINVVVTTMGGIESWRLGDMIPARSAPHNLDDRFPLAKMQIPLAHPENTTVSLGTFTDTSLTAKTNSTANGLRNFEDFSTGNIIASAVAQATKLIDTKTNGYVTLHYDEDRGCVDELLIMDTPDTSTAKRVWRWNLNGLGYSSTGYSGDEAAYGTAITMDGTILGKFIIANGMILADDNEETFGHFDSEGMKIYKQAGKSDNLSLAITKSGMTVYESTRTAEFTSGSVVFNYNDKQQGRLYAPGATAGLILELNDPDDGTPMLSVGDSEETATRVVRVVNKLRTLDFEVLESGQRGLWDPVYDRWLIGFNADGDTYLDAASSVTIGKPLQVNGAVTAGASSSVTGTLTVSGNITSNGNNVLTTASSKPIRFSSDYGNTTVTIPLTTATTDVSLSPLFSGLATSGNVNSVSDALNQFEKDVADTYATKSEIPSLSGYATEQWVSNNYVSELNLDSEVGALGYVKSESGDFVTQQELTNTLDSYLLRSAQASYSISNGKKAVTGSCRPFTTGMVFNLEDLFDDTSTSAEKLMCDGTNYAYFSGSGYYFGATDFNAYIEGPAVFIGGQATSEVTIGGTGVKEIEMWGNEITFNGSTIHSSDARLKTAIQPLNTSALDNLTPVSFKWRDGDERTHYGYIAQEVQPYMPELVSEGTDGMLGLAYTELIPLLHMEIKALKERIAQLEKGAA